MMLKARNAAVVLILSVAAVVANSEWGASHVVDMFRTRSIRLELQEERELRNQLDTVNNEIFRHIAIKDALIAELIAGRTTLAEVTRQFLVLNQSIPVNMKVLRSSYPGSTDEETTALNVIGYLMTELDHAPPAKRAEVLRRLNLEGGYPVQFEEDSAANPTPSGN